MPYGVRAMITIEYALQINIAKAAFEAAYQYVRAFMLHIGILYVDVVFYV